MNKKSTQEDEDDKLLSSAEAMMTMGEGYSVSAQQKIDMHSKAQEEGKKRENKAHKSILLRRKEEEEAAASAEVASTHKEKNIVNKWSNNSEIIRKQKSGLGSPSSSKKSIQEDKNEAGADGGIAVPRDSDILSGRGKYVNSHPGNVRFRALVTKHKVAYVSCPKPQKTAYAELIVHELHQEGARFLKQREPSKKDGAATSNSSDNKGQLSTHKPSPHMKWYELDLKQALLKTRQALREGAPQITEQLQNHNEDGVSRGSSSGEEEEVEVDEESEGGNEQRRAKLKGVPSPAEKGSLKRPAGSFPPGMESRGFKRAALDALSFDASTSSLLRRHQQHNPNQYALRASPSTAMILSASSSSPEASAVARILAQQQQQQHSLLQQPQAPHHRQLPPQLPLPQDQHNASSSSTGPPSSSPALLSRSAIGDSMPISSSNLGSSLMTSGAVVGGPSTTPALYSGAGTSSVLSSYPGAHQALPHSQLLQQAQTSSSPASVLLSSSHPGAVLAESHPPQQSTIFLNSGAPGPSHSASETALLAAQAGNSAEILLGGPGQHAAVAQPLLHQTQLQPVANGASSAFTSAPGSTQLSSLLLPSHGASSLAGGHVLTNEPNTAASPAIMMLLQQQQEQDQFLVSERNRLLAQHRDPLALHPFNGSSLYHSLTPQQQLQLQGGTVLQSSVGGTPSLGGVTTVLPPQQHSLLSLSALPAGTLPVSLTAGPSSSGTLPVLSTAALPLVHNMRNVPGNNLAQAAPRSDEDPSSRSPRHPSTMDDASQRTSNTDRSSSSSGPRRRNRRPSNP